MMRGAILAVVLALAGPLSAAPIVFVDSYRPAGGQVLLGGSGVSSFSFVHNINDNGFNSTTDKLLLGTIALDFQDDADAARETVNFNLDGVDYGTQRVFSLLDTIFFLDVSILQTDGQARVTLTASSGDVYFRGSTLTVLGDRSDSGGGTGSPAPEPATILLLGFGAGAAGILGARRRKAKARGA